MSNCPPPVVESDELVCRDCRMRWDRREDRPPCPKSFPPKEPDDRAKLEQLAKLTRDHISVLKQQRDTVALMIRACVQRLKSPDSRKRAEAIKALDELATMLEKAQ